MAETCFHFSPLRMAIQENFIPNLFGAQVDCLEADLICKPSRYGGMGILDPVETALPQFLAPSEATSYFSEVIWQLEGSALDLHCHDAQRQFAIHNKIFSALDPWMALCYSSCWDNFDMSPNEFRDAIALRYGRIPIDLPTHCDADGEVFSVNHALNCSKGGLVYGRHNELKDLN